MKKKRMYWQKLMGTAAGVFSFFFANKVENAEELTDEG